jgi:hypothetical protein
MDAPLYDIYLTGKLADGVSAAQASARLAQLFKSTPEAMAGLITGKPQVLKRSVDKATALKYREALARAGLEVAFKEVTPKEAVSKTVGAVAAQVQPEAPVRAAAAAPSGLTIAPVGADVLTEAERHSVQPVAVDTSHLSVAPLGELTDGATAPTPAAPDTSHLTIAAAGADLLSAAEREQPPAVMPDISDLTLAPAGSVLETLQTAAAPVNPDISGLSLAPPGADLLAPDQRAKPAPPPPSTDHLRVIDNPT